MRRIAHERGEIALIAASGCTRPDWIWKQAEKYYNEHQEELRFKDINSITSLIRFWILQGVAGKITAE